MPTPQAPAGRTVRSFRRTSPQAWGRGLPLRLEALDDRIAPSVNIPLNGFTWTELGPRPIAAQQPGEQTSSPGNLNSTGRVTGAAAHPTDPDTVYVVGAGGGVAKTTDGGQTWTELTDRLPATTLVQETGLPINDLQRSTYMGSIAISPVLNATGEYNVYAGEGELDFSGDSYAGKGILRSKDGGASWTLIEGPNRAFSGQSVAKIVVAKDTADPTKEIVFAAVSYGLVYGDGDGGGLFRSTDEGVTWTEISKNLNFVNGVSPFAALTDVTFDPSNPNVVYLAVGDPFLVNPAGDATYALNGIYKSTDALSKAPNWTVAFGGNGTFIPGSKLGRIQIALAPTNPSTLFAVVTSPQDKLQGVFRSQESGVNWRQYSKVPNLLVNGQGSYNLGIAVDPTNENNLFLIGNVGDTMVLGTADALNPNPAAVTWNKIAVDPDGEGTHADGRVLEFDAKNRLIAGTDGGFFRMESLSIDNLIMTPDWESFNGEAGPNALNFGEFVGIGLSPQSAEELFGGTQDNGVLRFFDDGDPVNPTPYGWAVSNGGDGGNTIIDFLDPMNLVHTAPYPNARVSYSNDGGKTWTAATVPQAGKGLFYPPIEADPSNNLRYFEGEDQVNVSADGGKSWATLAGKTLPYVTNIAAPDGPIPVTAIGVGRFDGNVIYAAVADRVANINGANIHFGPAIYQIDLNLTGIPNFPAWLDVSPGVGIQELAPFPGAPTEPQPNDLFNIISDIAVDPNDSNIVYITIESDFGPKIYRTTTGGVAGGFPGGGPVWVDITGAGATGLPPRRAFTVAVDPNLLVGSTDDDIYVGTEIGVYKLSDPTTAPFVWLRVGGESMPDTIVTDVEINTSIGILAASTYGRGVWELQIRSFFSGYKFEDINANGVREFQDVNGNGTQDIGEPFLEPGLPDFRIVVFNLDTNAQQANTLSRADGYYEFRSLPDNPATTDDYRLIEDLTLFPDWIQTSAPLPDFLDTVRTDTNTNLNFGNFRRTSINGVVFDDIDGDGVRDFTDANGNNIRDPGEAFTDPGIAGRTIELRNSLTNALVTTTKTVADGSYTFANLGPLQQPDPSDPTGVLQQQIAYKLVEIIPANVVFTRPAAPPHTISTTIFSGQPSVGNDFGNFTRFTISGIKFNDLNGNGAFDASEPGLPNWVFLLFDANNAPILGSGGVQVSAFTDATGRYQFTNLIPLPGPTANSVLDYRVREVVQTGWEQITVNPPDVPATSGQDVSGGNFGNFRLVNVTGIVFDDTNGDGIQQSGETGVVPGVVVHLSSAAAGFDVTAIVQPDGTYTFTGVKPQIVAGTVVPFQLTIDVPVGFIQTSADPAPFTVTSGSSVGGFAFGLFKKTSISGFVFTDINGNGFRDGLEPVGLTLRDGTPQPGGNIQLLNDKTGAVIGTFPVGTDGKFTFPDLGPIYDPGAISPYRVKFVPPTGWTFTPTDQTGGISLQSGVAVGPVTFGGFKKTSISGVAFDDLNGDGTQQAAETGGSNGATVDLIDTRDGKVLSTVTVGTDGAYTFADLGPLLSGGTNAPYRVIITPPVGWISTGKTSFDNVLFSDTPVGGQQSAEFKLITISGRAFDDQNYDKVLTPGEPGLAGWTVRLSNLSTGATASAVTDKLGNYSFPALGPGVYRVREDGMTGWIQLTADPADSPAVSGTNVIDVRFGNFRRIDITGTVFEDLDRDGTFDAGEPGSPGWTVNLLDTATGGVLQTLTVAADGTYAFPQLAPGKYDLRIVPREGWIPTTTDPATINTVSGVNVPGNVFGVLRLGSIRSFVFADNNRNNIQDASEPRLPGVTINLLDTQFNRLRQTVTDANGEFAFFNLEPGNYIVTFEYGRPGAGFIITNPDTTNGIPVSITSGSGTAGNDAAPTFGIASTPVLVVGADKGGGPQVQLFDALTGQQKLSFFAYDPSFTGGVRVAQGDVNGDGVADIIVASGPGGGPHVQAFDGVSGAKLFSFFAYEPSFLGGLFLAAGDLNGDGIADIITGTDIGGGPRVQVFDGATLKVIKNYFAYEQEFRGGVRVAVGDVNGDGVLDIITTPAEGGGPRVTARSGVDDQVLGNFFGFDPEFRGGLYVAAGDFNNDGTAEIAVGQGATVNPLVRTFTASGVQLASNAAFPPDENGNTFTAEVRVATTDRFGDGNLDVVVTSGPGTKTRLRFLNSNLEPSADELRPFAEDFTGGVFVG